MNPKVSIRILDGGLGAIVPQEDGTAMLAIINVPQAYYDAASVDKFAQVLTLKEAEALGITHANDVLYECLVWEHIKDFYLVAEDGSELHIFLPVGEDFDALFTPDEDTINYELEQYWQDNNIKLLGVTIAQSTVVLPDPNTDNLVLTAELDTVGATFTGAVTTLQTWIVRMQGLHFPLQALLGHGNFAASAAWAAFGGRPDLTTLEASRVSVMIGADAARVAELDDLALPTTISQIGIALGRLASIPVSRNIGRVRDGKMPVSIGIVAGADPALIAMPGYVKDALTAKGYIFYEKYAGKDGFFFSDDPTAAASDSDYRIIANGRVIDKAVRIAYQALLEYLKDEVQIDPATGRLGTAFVKTAEAAVENPILAQMNGEIVSVDCTIDPLQNILATSELAVSVSVVPFGYAKQITADIALSNPLNA